VRKYTLIFYLSLFALAIGQPAYAKSPISIRINAGVINYPLRAWSNFIGDMDSSDYNKDMVNPYASLACYYSLTSRQSIFIGTEYLRTKASLYSNCNNVETNITWKFKAIPVNIGYEYKLVNNKTGLCPIVTIGAAYFISELYGESYSTPAIFPPERGTRTGNGYGFFGGVGIQKQITESFYSTVNFRVRYSDGMYFTDDKEDIDVEFTSFDLNIGIGWIF
jgi:hypothetical protein